MSDAEEAADRAAVLRANEAFYAAFAAMDMDAMSRCWSRSARDACIHPGWDALLGWPSVRESWRAIFAGTGFARFQITDARTQVVGDMAWVTCEENMMMVSHGMTSHGRVAATNLFQRTDEGWKLVLHHGSPVSHTVSGDETDGDFN